MITLSSSTWRMNGCISSLFMVTFLLLFVIVRGEDSSSSSSSSSSLKDDPLVKMVCKVIGARRYVGLCQSDLEVLRVFGSVVSFLEEETYTWNPNVEFYPHSFYVRPRFPNDPIPSSSNECGGTNHNNLPITLLRVPLEVHPQQQTTTNKIKSHYYPTISTLSKLIQNTNTNTNTNHQPSPSNDYYSIMVQDSIKFQQCVNQSLFQHKQQHNNNNNNNNKDPQELFLLSWMISNEAISCRTILFHSFEKISDWFSEIDIHDDDDDSSFNNRKDMNTMLQTIVNVWGNTPQLLAYVILVNEGCNASDSYDEFISCRLVLGDDILLDMNIHKRNVDPNNIQQWKCETCGLHSVRPKIKNHKQVCRYILKRFHSSLTTQLFLFWYFYFFFL